MQASEVGSLPVTVLNGGCLNRCATLAHVKVCKLPIVLPRTDQAGVLQVEVDRGQLTLWSQLKVRRIGIADIPDEAAHRAVLWLLLELQDRIRYSDLNRTISNLLLTATKDCRTLHN